MVRKRYSNCHSMWEQLSYMLLHGMHVYNMVVSACSEGGVLSPLTSKGPLMDTHARPVGGSVVLTSLNQPPELELERIDSKFLKNHLGKHFIV